MSQQKRFDNTEHYHQSYHQVSYPPHTASSLPSYSTLPIKVEPHSSQYYSIYHTMESTRDNPMLTTAMAIPRATKLATEYTDFNYEYDQSQSPQLIQDTNTYLPSSAYGLQPSTANTNAMWSVIGDAMALSKQEPFPMDDDDIFQVDKADLFQAPTLAELNEDTILGDLNIDDFILPSDNSTLLLTNTPTLTTLQPHSFSASSLPPQQLLQQHHHHHQHQQHQQQHQSGSLQHMHSSTQGIPIGRDALLYDEKTNTSTSPYDIYTPTHKSLNSSAAFSPESQNSSNSPLLINSISPPPYILNNNNNNLNANNNNINNNHSILRNKFTTLQELLKQESPSPEHTELGQSVPGPSHMMGSARTHQDGYQSSRRIQFANLQTPSSSRLSSSAPTNSATWDQARMWARREPRQHLLSTGSVAEAGSTSSLSTGGILSPEAHDFSHDEGYEDSDSDHYEDYSTDDSDNEDTPRTGGSKKERFFWQYNVQAKGPKGQRLVIKTQAEDPHVLNEVTDPVFSPNCSVRGIKVVKHSGKARKGDGNDLTPNPRKLYNIGKELDKLGRTINDMTPVSELPFNVRPKSRKEKNKLASRACRLKKKAQHEANKIKLYGLETEHKKLISGIADIKQALAYKFGRQTENTEEVNQQIDQMATTATNFQIAGTSTDFVNKVLDKVKSGNPKGGLEELERENRSQ